MTKFDSATLLPRPPLALAGGGIASDYAAALLEGLGADVKRRDGAAAEHPALAWARSGAMALTGEADRAALQCPFPLASCAEGVLIALRALARQPLPLDGAALLGERAAAAGHTRAGRIAPGGSCRLLRAGDGWLALNLARPDDWALLPAWMECDAIADWREVETRLGQRGVNEWLERGRLLGLALSGMESLARAPSGWYRQLARASNGKIVARGTAPLVVDLSALWAGPLCSHVLQMLGARVVKVESQQRPDGARYGPAPFYDLLNAGKACVALDFGGARGREQLRALLARADMVIEASRPRALRQLGIHAEELVEHNPALTWISISGYGRDEPEANWIAYGDDAGVAAGLSAALGELNGQPVFCGDAIADPLTGLHAALLAWSGFRAGGGGLLSLSLRDVVAHCARFDAPASFEGLKARYRHWCDLVEPSRVALPRLRQAGGVARAPGADTDAVLAALGIPC